MMPRALPISIPYERLAAFCQANRIRRLALFGSVLRDDFTPGSDVDVLVEFEPGTPLGFIGLMHLQDQLSVLLARRVDLNTAGCLSRYFRDEVLQEMRPLYVAA